MTTQAERTNWTVYTTRIEARAAALEEATSTGAIQYVIKKPTGFIVTPDNSANPGAEPYAPPEGLNFTVESKLPKALTAVDIEEVEAIARADFTQDFYELLALRMYGLSPPEITDQHKYAVKEEVMRIKGRASSNGPPGETTLRIID